MRWMEKKPLASFRMVSTSSVTVQSLGKIGQRAPAVGAKIWCLFGFCFFVCYLFCFPCSEVGALFVRGKHILNKQCVTVNFDTVFTFFFRRDCPCPFRYTRQFPFSSPGCSTIAPNSGSDVSPCLWSLRPKSLSLALMHQVLGLRLALQSKLWPWHWP